MKDFSDNNSNNDNSNNEAANTPLTPDDARLTAMALGELEDAALMAEIEANPALKAEFERIRNMGAALGKAYSAESAQPAPVVGKGTKIVKFPLLRPSVYWPISGALAASIVVALMLPALRNGPTPDATKPSVGATPAVLSAQNNEPDAGASVVAVADASQIADAGNATVADAVVASNTKVEIADLDVAPPPDGNVAVQTPLAGTDVGTDIKDGAATVQVVNEQFLKDLGAGSSEELLSFVPDAEVGGTVGNVSHQAAAVASQTLPPPPAPRLAMSMPGLVARQTGSRNTVATSNSARTTREVQVASSTASEEDIVYLSPFEVTANQNIGYTATSTLAGTRLRTDTTDFGGAVRSSPVRQRANVDATQSALSQDASSVTMATRKTVKGKVRYVVREDTVDVCAGVGDAIEELWGDTNVPSREAYDSIIENVFASPKVEPLSTFSIDVDTASYTNVRRLLDNGQRVPAGAVRIEEMVNYFDYDYAPPTDKNAPFAAHIEATVAPWEPTHQIVRIGLKGFEIPWATRPASNLVFLVDVSGS
ncbi:MAG: von Willebrand factor type A domain-containing protein, partial [Opitutales bacterium]